MNVNESIRNMSSKDSALTELYVNLFNFYVKIKLLNIQEKICARDKKSE